MTGPAAIACVAAVAVLVVGARAWTSIDPARFVVVGPSRRRSRLVVRRAAASTDLDVAKWCDGVARDVRAGASLAAAVCDGDAHPGLAELTGPVEAALRRGQSLGAALRIPVVDATSGVGLALIVLRSCADLGGPAASPLERVAATLRDRSAIRDEQSAHSAQARMSARVMTSVPIGMLGLLAVVDRNVRAAIGTPAGLVAVGSGSLLNLAGWWWMRHIIVRPR